MKTTKAAATATRTEAALTLSAEVSTEIAKRSSDSGIPAAELANMMASDGLRQFDGDGITVRPKPKRITVPEGKVAVFIDEEPGKLMLELCEIADVEPGEWLTNTVKCAVVTNGVLSSFAIRWENGKLAKLICSGILDDFRYDFLFSPDDWEEACKELAEVVEREQRKAGKLDTQTATTLERLKRK